MDKYRTVIVSLPEKEPYTGKFHVWAGIDRNVYAVVEQEDGTVTQPYAKYVKFIPEKKRWWK